MKKNVAGQKWLVFAFGGTGHANEGQPILSDAANITAKIGIDYGTLAATNDVNPTEVEDGYYEFDLTQAETNGYRLFLTPESSTANVEVIGVPAVIFTSDQQQLLEGMGVIASGTLQSATGTTAVLAAATSFANDLVNSATLIIVAGTGAGQSRVVDDWDSATDTATVRAWTTTPDNTSQYVLIATPPASLVNVPSVSVSAMDADSVTAAALAADAVAEIQSGLATAAALATVDGIVDAILVDTGTDIPALITALDAVADAIKAKTDALTISAVGVEADLVGVHGDAFASGTKPFDT